VAAQTVSEPIQAQLIHQALEGILSVWVQVTPATTSWTALVGAVSP
jgi:hypothetical protein